ncbi:MAG: OprO/OprP family phosphate-selective porin [Prevotella sp.]|nr:OprO/OprP family phosphate-selective porin [Prevotella sp.]
MKKIMIALLAAMTLTANAQEKKSIEVPAWINNVKFSGYGMVQYQANDKENASENTFQLRLVRLALEGRIQQDWYWKMQIQLNGNTSSLNASPRIVDAFAEWQKFDYFKVKAGQFKRPFTFENPMHPITQGFMSYSQPVSKLSGFGDRTGEQSSNGRDIGVQIQGDFLKNSAGRNLLHYQVGVFNGEGINQKDKDNKKDIIGGMWVMPIKGLRIGAFGWTGTRYMATTQTVDGETVNKTESVRKNRYALSAEYAQNDWTVRTEYIHSQGFAANKDKGDKADGWYALAIAPIIKNKMHVKARYDCYRDQKTWGSSKTNYEIGADYVICKNVQVNVEYARVNERSTHSNYNLVDVELDFRF